jgi:radical SAM superfamily enzyme YgiQ (UPF0313 family)
MYDITIINSTFNQGKVVPLGPLYLVSVLENNGYKVDFKDYQLFNLEKSINSNLFLNFLLDISSNVIAISCLCSSLLTVLPAVQKLKEIHPEKIIILGGPGASGLADKILKYFPSIDIVVKGEGEVTIVDLMNKMTNGSLKTVEGISYIEKDKIFNNSPRKRIENLDKIPFPAYHKLDFDKYVTNERPFPVGIITARGCPFKCTFCDVAPMWGREVYTRSIENVIEEIKFLYEKYNQKISGFEDDTFVLSKKRVLQFCSEFKKEDLDIKWGCHGRIDLMDTNLMKNMYESGCNQIYYGIESGSDRVLDIIKKGFKIETALKVVTESKKFFEDVTASFMWGFPFETRMDMYDTIIAMRIMSKAGANVQMHLLGPLPFSSMCKEWTSESIQFDENVMLDTVKTDYVYGYNKESINLIKKYPDIFMSHYHYKFDDFQKRIDDLKKLGILNTIGKTGPKRKNKVNNKAIESDVNIILHNKLPKIKTEVLIRNRCSESYIFNIETGALHKINKSSAYIFNACINNICVADLFKQMSEKFDKNEDIIIKEYIINVVKLFYNLDILEHDSLTITGVKP